MRAAPPAIVCSLCVLASAALPATAADPLPNARYLGQTGQGRQFAVHLRTGATKVAAMDIAWRAKQCELAKNGAQGTLKMKDLAITDGAISKTKKTRSKLAASKGFQGGSQVARTKMRGSFTTAHKIKGTLSVDVKVFNKSGAQLDHCVTPNKIRWSASYVGVTDGG